MKTHNLSYMCVSTCYSCICICYGMSDCFPLNLVCVHTNLYSWYVHVYMLTLVIGLDEQSFQQQSF